LKQTFYSNGKLLITGEYVVLDGAKSLALPTKFSQSLIVEDGKNKEINWKSFDNDGSVWFETTLFFSDISNKTQFENEAVKTTLIAILHEAFILNPDFITQSEGYNVTTKLTFPRNWGLGTSSTLINNVATWTKVNAFVLLKNSFGGSGYDIACAQHNSPIIYQLISGISVMMPVFFSTELSKNIWFIYLNKKQDSKEGIANYRERKSDLNELIPEINSITGDIITTDRLDVFTHLLEKHEAAISNLLKRKTVKETLFPDFEGTIKSLGAWGGDFVMAVAKENPTAYFKSKGYNVVLPYSDLIL